MSLKKIFLIAPLYNEEQGVKPFAKLLEEHLDQSKFDFTVLFIDDGSRDKTWEQVEEVTKKNSLFTAAQLSRNFGKEAALAAGLDLLPKDTDACIILDGDGQHPPAIIPEMLETWLSKKVNIVEAIKEKRVKENFLVRLFSRLFYWILEKSSHFNFQNTTDFKLIDKNVIDAWRQLKERDLFFRGLTKWMGFKTETLKFKVPPREHGETSYSVSMLIKLALTGITSFSSLPLRFVFGAGALWMAFSLIGVFTIIYLKFLGQTISGMATVIVLILMTGSLIMLSLGVIGEYLARVYNEVKGRPRYYIQELSGDKNLYSKGLNDI